MADSSKKEIRTRHKACSLVRMALQWGRKVGVFKRWQLLRILFSKHLKTLAHHHHHHNNGDSFLFRYGERQLSFDETPLFNVKKKKIHYPASIRFLLPCISFPVDFDYDFEIDGHNYSDEVRSYGYDDSCTEDYDRTVKDDEEEDKGVDLRAEEFIAKFYQQIKLQRQISSLDYKEHNDVVLL